MNRMISFFLMISFSGYVLPAFSQVEKVAAIGITVKDMEPALNFYTRVLHFRKVSEQEFSGSDYEKEKGRFGIRYKVARLQLGDDFIELTDYLTSGGRNIPGDARSNDLIFQHIAIVVSDMEKAYRELKNSMVMYVSTEPQTIPETNKTAAGIKAFYFHDPDGHNLELIFFPKGKGQAKWQNAKGKLFLGIDHTAIAVRSTSASLGFYESFLGIPRKGESWNQGMEQARLNFVEGASLHITGLRTPSGPGIEFLEYLVPGPGKDYPEDTNADDLWFWQTTLVVQDAKALFEKCKTLNIPIVSRELVQIKDNAGKSFLSFIVRDPDRHAVRLVQSIN